MKDKERWEEHTIKIITAEGEEGGFVEIDHTFEYPVFPVNTTTYKENKSKGIQKSVSKTFTHQEYKDSLNINYKNKIAKTHHLKSEKHNMYLEECNKIAITNYDDKRFILSDLKTTLSIGNDLIPIIKNLDKINKVYDLEITDVQLAKVEIQYLVYPNPINPHPAPLCPPNPTLIKPLFNQVQNIKPIELKYFNTDPEYIQGLTPEDFKSHRLMLKDIITVETPIDQLRLIN